MLTVKNESGREIEISVYGDSDDIQIDEAYFADDVSGEEEVPDSDIQYVMSAYQDRIYK